MKTYGLIVADNGSDMYVSGTFDTSWDNDVLNPAFASLAAGDFEVVKLGWQPPTSALAVSDAVPVVEGNAGTIPAEFSVTLTPAFGETVTVRYATAAVTAASGSDYVAKSGTLTFAPGVTTRTVDIPVRGDLLHEDDETFTSRPFEPRERLGGRLGGHGDDSRRRRASFTLCRRYVRGRRGLGSDQPSLHRRPVREKRSPRDRRLRHGRRLGDGRQRLRRHRGLAHVPTRRPEADDRGPHTGRSGERERRRIHREPRQPVGRHPRPRHGQRNDRQRRRPPLPLHRGRHGGRGHGGLHSDGPGGGPFDRVRGSGHGALRGVAGHRVATIRLPVRERHPHVRSRGHERLHPLDHRGGRQGGKERGIPGQAVRAQERQARPGRGPGRDPRRRRVGGSLRSLACRPLHDHGARDLLPRSQRDDTHPIRRGGRHRSPTTSRSTWGALRSRGAPAPRPRPTASRATAAGT